MTKENSQKKIFVDENGTEEDWGHMCQIVTLICEFFFCQNSEIKFFRCGPNPLPQKGVLTQLTVEINH